MIRARRLIPPIELERIRIVRALELKMVIKDWNTMKNQIIGRIVLTANVTALAVGLTIALPQTAHAASIRPPAVPANIAVEAGNEVYFEGHGVGTQNYVCLPSGTGVAFKLFTPQATLFSDDDKQLTTHFFGPDPLENGVIRVAWEARDTSTVWGQVKPGNSSTDSAFVAPGAVAWLLVTAVGSQDGPNGGDTLTHTTFIQRLNTAGGLAPSVGCTSSADVGNQAFVPYSADYYFFKAADGRPSESD
jgi:hypothetical protein